MNTELKRIPYKIENVAFSIILLVRECANNANLKRPDLGKILPDIFEKETPYFGAICFAFPPRPAASPPSGLRTAVEAWTTHKMDLVQTWQGRVDLGESATDEGAGVRMQRRTFVQLPSELCW